MKISELIECMKQIQETEGDLDTYDGDMRPVSAESFEVNKPFDEEEEEIYGKKYLHIGRW